jgi:hypothetical protein
VFDDACVFTVVQDSHGGLNSHSEFILANSNVFATKGHGKANILCCISIAACMACLLEVICVAN